MTWSSKLKIWLGRKRETLVREYAEQRAFSLFKEEQRLELQLAQLVDWAVARREAVKCLQIGANDGEYADPLKFHRKRRSWSTWLIEPQPEIFLRLQENVKNEPNSVCLPYALSNRPGALRLYVVDKSVRLERPDGKIHDFSVHTSSDREKLSSEVAKMMGVDKTPESWINAIDLPTISWGQLLERIGGAPNVLVMDTEGMDAELLRTFPFNHGHPEVIAFEHMWMNRSVYTDICCLLEREGYRLMPVGCDTVALRQKLFEERIDTVEFQPR